MARSNFRSSGRLFVSILTAFGIACFSLSALAQQQQQDANVPAGCNANVWKALTAKADAQVAYDVAVTRQMINKPDSVLNITCFSQAAGVSAANGGAIFSGNFTGQLQSIMPVEGGGTYNCNEIGKLWDTIATVGVNTGAPYATFDQLLNGTTPTTPNGGAAGGDFTAAWNAAKTANVFNDLKTAVANLPQPPQDQDHMDFSRAKSSCDVLKTAGIIDDCPATQ